MTTTVRRPEPGVDFPRTVQEFDAFFGTEAACRQYLAKVRWPGGFICPRCSSSGEPWVTQRQLFQCRSCQHMASVTAGTALEDTRKPIRTWFQAMWYVTNQKQGVSALGLQRVLGLGSYKTAWTWLHKFRRTMVRPDRDRLSGVVEVDETSLGATDFGAKEARSHGRGSRSKVLVAVAVEKTDGRLGRIRLRRIQHANREELHRFVVDSVTLGATVHTDGWQAYYGLRELGYTHKVTVLHGRPSSAAHILMPYVHRIASLLKRWWLGTHFGAVAPEHLDYYLDEFTFRFNRRTSGSRGLLFYRLVQQAVASDHVPFRAIVGGNPAAARRRKTKQLRRGLTDVLAARRQAPPDVDRP